MWQATPENVQQLEQTKQMLESQLRDMQWRLEHEAKVLSNTVL